MRQLIWKTVIGALVAVGVWQTSSALYIYAKAWLAQHLIADAWSQTLVGDQGVRPWPWADAWPIARLRVPDVGADLFVLSNASGRTLAFGPGLLSGSGNLGESGNAVISAHRDTHFEFLRDVRSGSEVLLQTRDGRWHRYALVEHVVFDVRHDRLIVESERPTLTLLTCYPFDAIVPGGPMRYAAVAELVEEGDGAVDLVHLSNRERSRTLPSAIKF
jgi:sortase A